MKITVLKLAAMLLSSAGLLSAAEWTTVSELTVPAGAKLRGFGPCAVTYADHRSDTGAAVSAVSFAAVDADHARLVAGKFLGDLQDSFQVRQTELADGDRKIPIFLTAGGQAFAATVDGNRATLFGAPDQAALAAWFAAHPEAAAGALAEGPYPPYMRRFGWGVYGVDSFGRRDREGKLEDPTEDLQFLKELGNLHFDNHLDYSYFDTGDGIIQNSGSRWKMKYAAEHGIPYAHRVYVNPGGAGWTARRFPEYLDQPAWFLQNGWHGRGELRWKADPHFSWYAPDIQRYLALESRKLIEKFQTPEGQGWMHPHGELVHDHWYDMHADYSPAARSSWRDYLRRHGVTLAEASRMYRRPADAPFRGYEEIPVPEFATFAGLPGEILPLQGEWFYRKEPDALDQATGLTEKWYAPDTNLEAWKSITMPGSDLIYELYPDGRRPLESRCWFRRTFDYRPELAAGQKVWLYFFPNSSDQIHARGRYHEFYLNGEKIGEIGNWGALEVTDRLRKGANLLAFRLHGGLWDGRIFLSTEPPSVFPYLGPERNRLYRLWTDWRVDAKYRTWAEILDAMRQADPEKPIKFMAPTALGGDKWRKLALDYGGWPHFTGEGSWFFPWFKRYAKLYGLPATSELAGPHETLESQAEGYRRVFLAGLDGHEPVFNLQTYSRNPEIRKWWLDHRAVLNRMGKYDIDGPQVLIYRSSWNLENTPVNPYPPVAGTEPAQSAWNWDPGRGTLQSLGQSYLYLDDDGIADGKMYDYPLILDCGNETIDRAVIPALKRYIENGGTYVTLPFTGRHTREQPESFPIAELTGCREAKRRPLGGTVTFLPDTGRFAARAGKSFPDRGQSLDWLEQNTNLYSVELEPGKDCTVLAVYENGAPAIVERKLGKGRVIVLGSAFWRDAADRRGIWWPGENERTFIAELLSELKFPEAVNRTDDALIWAQPYRSNNGLDFVSVLVNWHEEGVQKPTVTLRLPRKPRRLVAYGVDGVRELPFNWRDGVLTAEVELPAREVKVLAAEVYPAGRAIAHWWNRQQELWQELVPSQLDLSAYERGKWVDPTLDLEEDARFTNDAVPENWLEPGFDDSGWTPAPLDVLNFWGARPGAPVRVRKRFTVNPEYLQGGLVRLISGSWSGPHYLNPARMWLNGKELHGFTSEHFNEFDVGALLRPGENVVAWEFQGKEPYTGFAGNVYLNYRAMPERSLALDGLWTGTGPDGKEVQLQLPGRGKVLHPGQRLIIPAEWRGKYRVYLFLKGAPRSVLGIWVNGRLVRRHHHHLGRYCDLDLTDYLNFGGENTLELAHAGEEFGRLSGQAPDVELETLRLDLYPAARFATE